MHHFFSPKTKVSKIENEQLSKVDGKDEVEGEREGQQKRDRDRIQGQGDPGQEKVGEHGRCEDMEGEHHQDEEGQSKREDHVQGSDSEKESVWAITNNLQSSHMVWKLLLHSILIYI